MAIFPRVGQVLGSDGVLCLLVAAVSLAVAFLATPVARRIALHHGATDNPGGRRIHERVTPRLGGTAVLVAILAGTVLGLQCWTGTDVERVQAIYVIAPILLVAGIVCLFGALDDLTPIAPLHKLLGLAVAGLLLGASGVSIDIVRLPGIGPIELGALAVPATILWVLACANAVNLIDGVDGTGAGVVTISACSMMLLSLGLGDLTTGMLFAATCGGAAGFLIHNRQPASIFLGDSGSLLLGFVLAAASAAGCTKGPTALTLVGALLALAVPFLDATQSFVRRFRAALRRQAGWQLLAALRATAVADVGHIHHRLLYRGLSHRQVSFVIGLVTTVTSLTALMLLPTGEVHWLATCATLLVSIFVLARLSRVEALAPAGGAAAGTGEAAAGATTGAAGAATGATTDAAGAATDTATDAAPGATTDAAGAATDAAAGEAAGEAENAASGAPATPGPARAPDSASADTAAAPAREPISEPARDPATGPQTHPTAVTPPRPRRDTGPRSGLQETVARS